MLRRGEIGSELLAESERVAPPFTTPDSDAKAVEDAAETDEIG
jgi:hypothetical protein